MDSQSNVVPLSRAERRRRVRVARGGQAPDLARILKEDGLSALAYQTGTATLLQLMQAEVDQQCGVAGKWEQNPHQRLGYRNGWGPGAVWIGGRYVAFERPRAVLTKAAGGGEIILESYLAAQDPAFASDAVLTALVLGVSQRCYPKVVDAVNPVGEVEARNLSKSAIGRQFIAASSQYLKTFLSRKLSQRYLVVWVDAVAAGGYSALAAVGLTETGEKQVLGLRQCSSEGAAECREFLEELVERGLSEQGVLFVVDGGKGLGVAIREVFGPNVLVQRCQIHKKRNVLDKLPESARDVVGLKLEEIWSCHSPQLALAKLELLARSLEAQKETSAAARSLREGGRDLLTCCILGVPPALLATVTNTNVIESAFSLHESTAYRVKRWRNGKQFLRWVAAGLYRAEKGFVRQSDSESLAKLAHALTSYAETRGKATTGPRLKLAS